MTRQEQFAAALGVEPDEIKPGGFAPWQYGDPSATSGWWALTRYNMIRVEFGTTSVNVMVAHSIGATVAGLKAAVKSLNDTIDACDAAPVNTTTTKDSP